MVNMGEERIAVLIRKFAIPATISYLVSALYNIVDQIFIGQKMGYIGNAATNVAFPLTTICMAVALLFGTGCSANVNIELGKGNKDKVRQLVGSTFGMLFIVGILLTVLVNLFMDPILVAFGATNDILPSAKEYASVTSLGFLFFLSSTAGNFIVRGDGSATYSMIATVSGAVLNLILDPILIFGFDMGIRGAAIATLFSQILSGIMILLYLPRYKSVKLKVCDFIPRAESLKEIAALGIGPMVFQISSIVVQLTTNNLLKSYGAQSIYGSDVPIAVAGIVMKLNAIYIAFIMGITQGTQPIYGFNYGAKLYDRVKETFRYVVTLCSIVSAVFFVIFEAFPKQIMQLFGNGNELYMAYGVRYIRVFLFCVLLNGSQIAITLFFQAIGKPKQGTFLSLARQGLLLLPLLIIMSYFTGVDGIMYAGPIADTIAWILAIVIIFKNWKKIMEVQ